MCNPASFVVTKDSVLFSKFSDSHEVILEENNLRDDSLNPAFVRVEITPPRRDFSRPFSEWRYITDQDLIPDWYSRGEAEAACRARLSAWARHHLKVVGQGVFGDGVTKGLVAYNGDLDLRGADIRILPDGLTVEGHLILTRTRIEKLPNNLTVGGELSISYTGITEIPRDLTVRGGICAFGIYMTNSGR